MVVVVDVVEVAIVTRLLCRLSCVEDVEFVPSKTCRGHDVSTYPVSFRLWEHNPEHVSKTCWKYTRVNVCCKATLEHGCQKTRFQIRVPTAYLGSRVLSDMFAVFLHMVNGFPIHVDDMLSGARFV